MNFSSIKLLTNCWLSTLKKLFQDHRNDMSNCIVSHMSNIIKMMVINIVNNILSKIISSNQPPLFTPVVTRYVCNFSPFIDAHSVWQNKQIGDNQIKLNDKPVNYQIENIWSMAPLVPPNVNSPVRPNLLFNVDNPTRPTSPPRPTKSTIEPSTVYWRSSTTIGTR